MKIMSALAKRAVAALAIVMLATPLWAQTMHSGERTDDATGIHRNMTALRPAPCGLNQAAVGSTCVNITVTPPQPTCGAGYVLSGGGCVSIASANRSWVSYFLGQSRPVLGDNNVQFAIATINQDGTTTFHSPNNNAWWGAPAAITAPVPLQNVGAATPYYNPFFCASAAYYSTPIFTTQDKFYGGPPSDWQASYYFDMSNCPIPSGI